MSEQLFSIQLKTPKKLHKGVIKVVHFTFFFFVLRNNKIKQQMGRMSN